MGLRELAVAAARTAFTAAGNIPESATYRSMTAATATYSAGNGTISSPYTDYPNVSIIFANYKSEETDGQTIRATDVKAIFPSNAVSFTPKGNDIVIRAGFQYEIKSIRTDPAGAAWILQLRKP